MKKEIRELIDVIKGKNNHLLIVSGNIYDLVVCDSQKFSDAQEFLSELTKKKFPQLISYDLFSGISVIRGDVNEISAAMGLRQPETPKTVNENLVQALKKAKMMFNPSQFPVNPLEAFTCFDRLLGNKESKPTAIIIDYADAVVPAQLQGLSGQLNRSLGIALTKWSRSVKIRERGHLIVLLCRRSSDLDEGVLDRVFQGVQVRIPKPDLADRVKFLKEKKLPENLISLVSKVASGLSLNDLEKISSHCSRVRGEEAALEAVFSIKEKVLRDEYGDLLEIIQPAFGFEAIGGLEKSIAKLQVIADAMRRGETSIVPQGILFMGPPGTGKTALTEAFAKEASLNFVKPLDIKSMWLGESERRMTAFINALKDLSPVAVFIDEFDQSQGKRGGFEGDSNVSKNLFKKMLEVMSDTSLRGKILWIMATNRPDLIDPAIKRPGRCDLRIPFLPPDVNQLALICKSAFVQYPDMRTEIEDWPPYVNRCLGYTGADMIEVVRRAWERANELKKKKITEAEMDWACGDYQPQILDKRMVAIMTLIAIIECSSKNLLPENWEKVAGDCYEELTGKRPKQILKDIISLLKRISDPGSEQE